MIETKYIASGQTKDGWQWYLYTIVIKIRVQNMQTVRKEFYLAVAKTQYKVTKTRRGAMAWLKRMGATI